jgi:mono/diheme cytochrome c family protein
VTIVTTNIAPGKNSPVLMKKLIKAGASVGLVVLVAAGMAWLASEPRPADAGSDGFFSQRGDAKRGKLVFTAAGCESCHATKVGGEDQENETNELGGGLALPTPFGVFYAPNISPDKADGIGSWTDAQVADAFLSGVRRDGEELYPVLPYTSYSRMTRDDARDLIAYLRTLPAVAGRPPPNKIRFPFSIRRTIGLWKAIYFHPQPIVPDPRHDVAWNRGRYLTLALAHCAECHSPRDAFGGVVKAQEFAGGPDPATVDGWFPNITPAPDGIGGWTTADMVELLTDGLTPDDDKVNSPMIQVVHNIAQLPKFDAEAIATYIKSLPPREGPSPPEAKN